MSCSSNIRQFGIALLNYEYSYKLLPAMAAGFGYANPRIGTTNLAGGVFANATGNFTGLVGMLPMMEQQVLYSRIDSGFIQRVGSGPTAIPQTVFGYGQLGDPVTTGFLFPWDGAYTPARTQVGFFRCPSDPGRMNPSTITSLARTNYVFNCGDSIAGVDTHNIDNETTRGPFPRANQLTLASVTDGTSNTIMFGEVSTVSSTNISNPLNGDAIAANPAIQGRAILGTVQNVTGAGGGTSPAVNILLCKAAARGGIYPTAVPSTSRFATATGTMWLRAGLTWSGFQTIIGPNGASCYTPLSIGGIPQLRSAGSYHFGGAHVVTFDNSIKFVPNEIDTTNSNPGALPTDYTSPGRFISSGVWDQTANWNSPSVFGVWGALGTRGAEDDVGVMPGA